MHFRDRANVIQLIRSTYDPATKRARTEIVGRIPKANPGLSEPLRQACTPAEIAEIESWLGGYGQLQKLKAELAARTLGEQMTLAGEWFEGQEGEDARFLAASLAQQWGRLRQQLKKQGLVE